MEPLLSLLIPAITETVFGALAEAAGLSDWLRQRLGRDLEKLAFQSALTQALTAAAPTFPGRDLRYFTETLRDVGGPLLARTLQPAASWPTPEELTQLWLNHLTIDSAIHYRQEFATFATLLLDQLNQHIENQQPLQWIVQARRQRSSEEAIRRLAEAAEQSAATLDALRQELAQLTGTLETVLKTGGTTVSTAGGAYVAENASAHNFVGRDLTIKNYFVTGLPRLVIDYSARIQDFLLEYLGSRRKRVPFGGRQQQLDKLHAWLDDPVAPPYYLMSAEAGRGKSALVCRWLAQLTTRPDLALIFLPISIRFETATQDVVFAALAARLAAVFGEEMKAATLSAEEWKGVCQSYLRRSLPDGKRLLVILDGLDEAAGWTPGRGIFSADPPDGLRVLVTARTRPGASSWTTPLGWEDPRLARIVTLSKLNRHGVEQVLASMGNPLDTLATKVDVVGELYRLSEEGDPLLVRLYVDDLVKQGDPATILRAEDLLRIPSGFEGYFDFWWQEQQVQWDLQGRDPILEHAHLRRLINALSGALGPLTIDDLSMLHNDLADSLLLRRLVDIVRRWLIGDGRQSGYSFSHSRLNYYFWEQLNRKEQREWNNRFCDWGEQTLNDLNTGVLAPKTASIYLLRYYAAHLDRAAAPPERFYDLISNGWRRAWEAVDTSYVGFLNDVDIASTRARHTYQPDKAGRSACLVQQVKAALCQASVATLGSNLPATLLVQSVRVGLRTPLQALTIIKIMTDDQHKALALSLLIPYLAKNLLMDAFAIICSLKNMAFRVEPLTKLAAHLPEELMADALITIHSIKEVADRAHALRELAPRLPEERMTEALTVARSIEDNWLRAETMIALLARLPESQRTQVVSEVLAAAHLIKDAEHRACALRSLALRLPPSQQTQVLSDALAIIQSIRDEYYRTRALEKFSQNLPKEWMAKTLASVSLIVSESSRSFALSLLAPHLSAALFGDALAIVRSIQDGYQRCDALAALAPYWLDNQRSDVLGEALATVQLMGNESARGRTLAAYAPYLPKELLGKALTIALSIDKKSVSADAVIALAPHLSKELLDKALIAVRSIKNEYVRANALSRLASYLPDNQCVSVFSETLIIIRSIVDETIRELALSNFIGYLPKSKHTIMFDEILVVIQSIESEHSRVRALQELAPHLSKELMYEAITDAHLVKDEFSRIAVLRALAPPLSKEILGEILAHVRSFPRMVDRVGALDELAPHLSEELVGDALEIAYLINDEPNFADVLGALAPNLPDDLLNEAFTAVRKISRERDRALALGRLIPRLSEELLSNALMIARTIKEGFDRANVLRLIASYSSESQRSAILIEALAAIRAVASESHRADALIDLMPHLPEDLLGEALKVVGSFSDKFARARTLAEIGPRLSKELLEETFTTVRLIKDESAHAYALSALAPYLAEELQEEVLTDALAIRDEYVRSWMLRNLALCVTKYRRPSVLRQALVTARLLRDNSLRAHALGALIPHLSEPQRPRVLREALKAAHSLSEYPVRASALNVLAPHLPQEQQVKILDEALSAVAHIKDEYERVELLNELAPNLPEKLLSRLLDIVCSMTGESERAKVLINLVQRLPKRLLEKALTSAHSLEGPFWRAHLLSALAPRLLEHQRLDVWTEVLLAVAVIIGWEFRTNALEEIVPSFVSWANQRPKLAQTALSTSLPKFAACPRPQFLEDLTILIPVVLALAGDEAPQAAEGIYHAIQEICAWWP